MDQKWIMMQHSCKNAINNHLKEEFRASLTYLAMSAYFQQEVSFRPAVSKFFLDSAAEERGHAKQLMNYVLMRGLDISDSGWQGIEVDVDSDLFVTEPETRKGTVLGALEKALQLETKVTNAIRKIIIDCESSDCGAGNCISEEGQTSTTHYNDYHTVDYLTGDFLTEQHESTRQLAGMIANLKQTIGGLENNQLAEMLFDQSLG